jgi:hypothetical protein
MYPEPPFLPPENPKALRSALFEGGFSKGSLLGSLLLHVLVAGLALGWVGREHRPSGPYFVLDMKHLQPPGPKVGDSAPGVGAAGPQTPEATEALGDATALPLEPGEPPAPAGASREAIAQEELPVSAESAGVDSAERSDVLTGGPPILEESRTPLVYSELQRSYYLAVMERVQEVTYPWRVRSLRWPFEGWISFHLCLDEFGRLLHDPVLLENEEGRAHMHLVPVMSSLAEYPPSRHEELLNWHLEALRQRIVRALRAAQPYPRAPAGMVIPENFAFPIELNAIDVPLAAEDPAG